MRQCGLVFVLAIFGAMLLGVAVATPSAKAVTPASAVCENFERDPVLIVRIQLYPSAADASLRVPPVDVATLKQMARRLQSQGELWFNSLHTQAADGRPLRLKLEVGVRRSGDIPDPSAHQIEVTGAKDYQSRVFRSGARFGTQRQGTWSRTILEGIDVRGALHEVGHLAGLPDTYLEKVTSTTGAMVDVPPFMVFSPTTGEIYGLPAWYAWASDNNMDLATMRVVFPVLPGFDNDLMGDHNQANRLHPRWIAQLQGEARDCSRSLLREPVVARTCYSMPEELGVKYQPYLPYLRIADPSTAVGRYPLVERKPFDVRMACEFKYERIAVIELIEWSQFLIKQANQLSKQLEALEPQLANQQYQDLERKVQQAQLNAGAIGTEAIYRSSIVDILAIRDRPGYEDVSEKRLHELAARVVRFIRSDLVNIYN